jgi:hypothetical protein
MQFRPASGEDVDILEYWDTQPHVIAAGGAWDDFDQGDSAQVTPARALPPGALLWDHAGNIIRP